MEGSKSKFQQALHEVLGLYINANSAKEDIKCGIAFAHTAIEYICCHFKVSGKELDSKQPREKYKDDDFRKLFCSLCIPLDRPEEETPELQKLVDKLKRDEESKRESKRKTIDTLRAFRKTRNSIMHSRRNKNVPLDDERFLQEARNWGLWCVEMFIFAALKHKGKYINRLKPSYYPSNIETVPWVTAEKPDPALND